MIVVAFVPTEAAKKGLEKGICGDCPLKLSQTGACFVNLLPVNNIYRKYLARTYPKFSANEIEVIKRYRYPIRIGSYGDPTAVPFDVWEPIISASGGILATHTDGVAMNVTPVGNNI